MSHINYKDFVNKKKLYLIFHFQLSIDVELGNIETPLFPIFLWGFGENIPFLMSYYCLQVVF